MLFCMLKISFKQDGDDVTVYFSLLSSIVGLYMPSPSPFDNRAKKFVNDGVLDSPRPRHAEIKRTETDTSLTASTTPD
jgi:hypothetical protein